MAEIWKPIPDWPYEASDRGRIRRSEPGAWPYGSQSAVGRVLSPSSDRRGYQMVNLSDSPRLWPAKVHQLVALAFHGPCPEGMEVNHINSDPSDNRAKNLEYVTRKENIEHSVLLGRMPGLGTEAWKDLRELAATGLFDASDLAEIYSVSRSTLSERINVDVGGAWAWLARSEARHLRFFHRVFGAA